MFHASITSRTGLVTNIDTFPKRSYV